MAASRGSLTIADRVVEKTASEILKGIPGVGGTTSGFLGIGGNDSLDARPSVSVTLSGRSCVLDVRLGLRYPLPISQTTESVRETLRTEVESLTGVAVRQVDIDVTWLRPEGSGRSAEVRSLA